ncbi:MULTISPECIES: pseudouridine synthase [Breznakia]|uniref:Pseudouridine synthase n=1 Tax=Breznakia blatticola TaxID=1754012 RepID=A0A4R7ZEC0_9FIRM|nr:MULTISPECIES: pseudouridine synthase [Breznakia]MDH6367700.1 23S rRNA pseudouridine2605 synthase [Breznakia sp. PH1-1]MDH6404788.1 23S rRNA pseudouridine2605 synthase [Breznakia sp. PF1-11]MDH6412505.1 23S rRNA pseudouridine2605 synthase [Breznakia sp. PFB1-11]MDH6414865.1 23S rRNA pseudouridine2605 synthase [Breznakia sp. PFB1-14]MDH6417176.1 23S rRNA pseudouridine2605 synthase [Breznakia sp. PFB1-4]
MERIQKVIAASGVASRRKAEEMIKQGRVKVNGVVLKEMGYIVKRGDAIQVDGKSITKENKVYYVMNKPKKTMCTNSDEFDRPTVFSLVDSNERLFSVGRLDYDTSGVLILTNDGNFANTLAHPRYHLPKTYNLTLNGILTPPQLMELKSGIVLDDGHKTLPAKYKVTEKDHKKNQMSLDLTIVEGRNRQIKRMIEHFGYHVTRLHRKQLGNLKVDDLRQGEYRILKPYEVKKLKQMATEGSKT